MSYIIMKYDDLSEKTQAEFARVGKFSVDNNMPVSMGVIGASLETDKSDFIDTCIAWSDHGIELWNHGYFHTDDEFSTATFDEQCSSLANTQRLMKEKLGKSAVTFGSPHNNSTETTIRALKKVAPEITNFLFAVDGISSTGARQLLVRCNMETVTGNIEFDFFKRNYELLKDLPYMIIQGHPSYWKEKDFQLNEDIMKYLSDEGNIFVTPSKLPNVKNHKMKEGHNTVELLDYIKRSDKKIALYGSGQIGREVYRYLTFLCGIEVEKFVVSDGQNIHEETICGIPVMHYSDFLPEKDANILILTLMPDYHKEICKKLSIDSVNFFYLNDAGKYLRMINEIRFRIF